MGTREYKFVTGITTPAAPTASTPSASADVMTKGYADANYDGYAPTVTGTRAAPTAVVAAAGIVFSGTQKEVTKFISGSGGAVTVSANPRMTAGTAVGQKCRLIVPTGANTVNVPDGQGMDLNGQWSGEAGSALDLEWDGTNWFETGRR